MSSVSQSVGPTDSKKRITALDALRGFALVGILMTHIVEQYYSALPPQGVHMHASYDTMDKIVQILTEVLLRGKFFMLFSFMFGLSFFIQIDNSAKKGINFRPRFIWKVALLFCIGYTHHMMYRGDILMTYSLLALPLLAMYNCRTRTILIAAAILFIVPRFIALYVTDYLDYNVFISPNRERLHYYLTLTRGSLWDLFEMNGTEGFVNKWIYAFGPIGRGYQTLGLFLLGMFFGRSGITQDIEGHRKFLKKMFLYSWVGLGVSASVMALFYLGLRPHVGSDLFISGMIFYDLSNLSLTSIYVSGFFLLWHYKPFKWVDKVLAPYGRTALTNYVTQSMIGTFLFYGYGLRWTGTLSAWRLVVVGFIICLVQIIISACWLKIFKFGPLEWLWRSGTYLKLQPIFKSKKTTNQET
jgi:uncharacterized protein